MSRHLSLESAVAATQCIVHSIIQGTIARSNPNPGVETDPESAKARNHPVIGRNLNVPAAENNDQKIVLTQPDSIDPSKPCICFVFLLYPHVLETDSPSMMAGFVTTGTFKPHIQHILLTVSFAYELAGSER
jgi:hypothetical protein